MIATRRLAYSQLSRNILGSASTIVSMAAPARPTPAVCAPRTSIRELHSPAVRRYNRKNGVNSKTPTVDIAKTMATGFAGLDNASLVTIAAMENYEARCEVLKRHIMAVDEVSYEEAEKKFREIAKKNREGVHIARLPYQIGITAAVTAGFASFPLCFDLTVVKWFNEAFVTTDVPEPRDLETWLEVGSWAWNWMEPPLGQISFFLLCLQYARAQMGNLGAQPYTDFIKQRRARILSDAFPQYDDKVVMDFSESDKFMNE